MLMHPPQAPLEQHFTHLGEEDLKLYISMIIGVCGASPNMCRVIGVRGPPQAAQRIARGLRGVYDRVQQLLDNGKPATARSFSPRQQGGGAITLRGRHWWDYARRRVDGENEGAE
jgi:hypothetical protein